MKTKLSILSISILLIMSGAAIAPALGNISETFNNSTDLFIKMILTISSLMIIPSSIISGKLTGKIKKRSLLIVGVSIYIIGGLGGGFAKNIYVLFLFRALLGIGVGLILPLSTGLIVDFFKGAERNKMMGYAMAVNNLGAVIAIISAGALASINWRFSFGVYGIAFFTLFMIIFNLPEHQKHETKKYNKLSPLNKNIYLLMLLIGIVNIIFYSVPTNISIIIKNMQLGDARISGIIISTLNLTSFVIGIFFHTLSNYFKKYTLTFSLTTMFIGFLLLTISNSIIKIVFSLIFIGIGLGIILPLIFVTTGKYTSHKNSTFAMALVNSSMYFGQFLSPLSINFTAKCFNNNSIKFPFIFSFILIGILLSITLFKLSKNKISIFE